jgi:hypothetical protein
LDGMVGDALQDLSQTELRIEAVWFGAAGQGIGRCSAFDAVIRSGEEGPFRPRQTARSAAGAVSDFRWPVPCAASHATPRSGVASATDEARYVGPEACHGLHFR